MAVMKRLRRYPGSARDHDTAEQVTRAMNGGEGTYGKVHAMHQGERIVSMLYIDGAWWFATEELVMGPTREQEQEHGRTRETT